MRHGAIYFQPHGKPQLTAIVAGTNGAIQALNPETWRATRANYGVARDFRAMAKSTRMPMPIELVLHHPLMAAAGNSAHTAVLELACAYWLSECRPLPPVESDLLVLGRTNSPTWLRHSAAIHAALDAILPALARAREAELARIAERRQRATRAYATAALKGTAPPHHSPLHVSKRRKVQAATPDQVAAQQALTDAGIHDMRPTAADIAAGTATRHPGLVVDLPPAHVVGVPTGGGSQRKGRLIDAGTRRT